MAKIRVGIIGYGAIAPYYLNAIKKNKKIELKIICDLKYKDVPKGCCFKKNYRSIKVNDLELVIIATPPISHFKIAKYFLNININVLIEKPAVINTDQLDKLIIAQENSSAKLFFAYHSQYNPLLLKLKALLHNKKIIRVSANCTENILNFHPDSKKWIFDNAMSGGGCVIDSAINILAATLTLVKDIRIKSCYLEKFFKKVEIKSIINFNFLNGEGKILNEWNNNKRTEKIKIITENKDEYIIDYANMVLRRNKHILKSIELTDDYTDMAKEYENLIADIPFLLSNQNSKILLTQSIKPLSLVFDCYSKARY